MDEQTLGHKVNEEYLYSFQVCLYKIFSSNEKNGIVTVRKPDR